MEKLPAITISPDKVQNIDRIMWAIDLFFQSTITAINKCPMQQLSAGEYINAKAFNNCAGDGPEHDFTIAQKIFYDIYPDGIPENH
jgi:hypothetical protein